MKRLNLVLFGVILLNLSVFAQIGGTTQRGKATQEMDDVGFFAAHNSFPLGSTIKVVNAGTGDSADVVVKGRIPVSTDRIVDLSYDVWDALGLNEGDVVMIVYTPAVSRPVPATVEPVKAELPPEITEKPRNEMPRLKTAQPLYYLLVLDRRHCEENSDISDLHNIKLLYKFLHNEKGYLVALYASFEEGPVFPVMPDNSRIIVNLISKDLAFIREYANSAPFKRFVRNPQATSGLQAALNRPPKEF